MEGLVGDGYDYTTSEYSFGGQGFYRGLGDPGQSGSRPARAPRSDDEDDGDGADCDQDDDEWSL